MLISLNWLKKFVDVPKGFTPEDLALKLTLATVEIEGVENTGELLNNIVLGKVLELKKHPNADKLKIAKVDIGSLQPEVVCGGTNLREGMLVAFGKVGAKMKWHGQGELEELKAVKIRGVESAGMICASNEIGIESLVPCPGEEVSDLSNLKIESPLGTPLTEVLNLNDVILEVDNKSITHRPDLWGHYGLARELAAVCNVKLRDYEIKPIKNGRGKKLTVTVKDKGKCRRYLGVVIDNVKVGPSPEWLAKQLESVGVRSINNIVDITNYVMLEIGEPLHAFDWREINGGKIIVDTAKKGEKFITLDGQERVLDEEILLIKDAKRAVALAGVMGGQNSEIKDNTTTILYEAANFEPINIRKTSLKLGLRTEGSARWEKSLSPVIAELALQRTVALTLELCPGAKVASKVVDEKFFDFKEPEIELDLAWLNRRIGAEVPREEVIDILERLQFEVKDKKEALEVKIPYWRATKDIFIPEDLVEEVARIYGYDNIKPTMPLVPLAAPEVNWERQVERRVKDILAENLAFSESYNYSFVNRDKIGDFGLKVVDHIVLKNYLSADQSLLRTSLIPNLLKNVVDNLRFYEDFKIFEIGRVFWKQAGAYSKHVGSDDKLPFQDKFLSAVVVEKDNQKPFYVVKGALESLFKNLNLDYQFQPLAKAMPAFALSSRVLEVAVKGKVLGTVGEVSDLTRSKLDISSAVGYFELDFTELAKTVTGDKKYQELLKYPVVYRDLALLLSQNVSWEEVKKAVKKIGGELVRNIELFDVYEGDKIEVGQRSLAFHLEYYSAERTLEAKEVDEIQQKIIAGLEKKFGAKTR